ncbi:uncharacterized protein LOC125605082 [Brassica napus]|uniref:uncharacterized protein LOC125605082 n=1 Tax=Brassica napus TaxID=3708 RepID=UPI0020784EB1|nr:uncharacterized protein LOC125605082 [Brassica napus]
MAISIIRHHLTKGLKDQYLTIENPLELWTALQRRYDHQKTVLLPKATYDWKHLRIQDLKTVDEYNSALFKIVSKMRLCGETVTEKDLLEKTFSTFHSSNVLLQHQYRKKGFTTYTDLISCLLFAEANNELLMRNTEMRPPGSTPLPEANKAVEEKKEPTKESNHVHHDKPHGYRNGYGRGGRGGWRGRGGRGNYSSHGRGKGNHYNRGSGPSYGRSQVWPWSRQKQWYL